MNGLPWSRPDADVIGDIRRLHDASPPGRMLEAPPPFPSSLAIPPHLVERLWAELMCGGCGQAFIAEPGTVPCFAPAGKPNRPCCRLCWDRRNELRARGGLTRQERPPCYPFDYRETR